MWGVVRHCCAAGVLCTLFSVGSVAAAEDIEALERRIERLEAQVELLMERMGADAVSTTSGDSQVPTATGAESRSDPGALEAPVPVAGVPGEALAAYYLSANALDDRAPGTQPLTRGLVTPAARLELRPERYGVAEPEVFSGYNDPSRYRAAGLHLTGYLDLPYAGSYQLTLAPKPAREGGGSPVVNTMAVRLEIAGEAVIEERGLRSWRHMEFSRVLPEGRQPFSLWLVSNSPGYGASPVDSTLTITLRLPGRTESTPLSRFMRPPEP